METTTSRDYVNRSVQQVVLAGNGKPAAEVRVIKFTGARGEVAEV